MKLRARYEELKTEQQGLKAGRRAQRGNNVNQHRKSSKTAIQGRGSGPELLRRTPAVLPAGRSLHFSRLPALRRPNFHKN